MQRIKSYMGDNWLRIGLFALVVAVCIAGGAYLDPAAGVSMAMSAALGEAEIKQLEDMIGKQFGKVKESTERMQQALDQGIAEVKRLETVTGKTSEELKAASEQAKATQNDLKELRDRMLEIEQKIAQRPSGGGMQGKSWGQMVAESDAWKAANKLAEKGKPEMGPVEVGSWHKTAILSGNVQTGAGTVSYLTPAERVPGIVRGPDRQLIVRTLIPVYATDSNLVEFARELLFTNNAAPQGGGSSPVQTEGQLKAESSLTFEFVQQAIITLAHWIPASRQILADAKMLQSYIDQRLRYGVLLEEEDEVLNGTGANGTLTGLVQSATTYNRGATGDQALDTLLKAMLQVTLSDYAADGVVLSSTDWTNIMLLKDSEGRYLFGNPAQPMVSASVWGRPVAATNSLTAGTFLVGAFQLAAALWDREQATVRISESHDDFFVRNLVALLAEERVALTVYRPAAIVKGSI